MPLFVSQWDHITYQYLGLMTLALQSRYASPFFQSFLGIRNVPIHCLR